jgi:hypothetical protein
MAKEARVHYTNLQAAIRDVLAAHDGVRHGIAAHTEKHADFIEKHRKKQEADALLKQPPR